MKAISHCCGEYPAVWKGCEATVIDACCRGCIEKIECNVCDRIIYGYDNESIDEWNNGQCDDNEIMSDLINSNR